MVEEYWGSIEYSCILLNFTIVLFALLLYYKLATYRVIGSGCDKFVGEEMQGKCDLYKCACKNNSKKPSVNKMFNQN